MSQLNSLRLKQRSEDGSAACSSMRSALASDTNSSLQQ